MNECMQQSLGQKNTRENGIEKADLEENTVDDVLRILRAEFEE